MTVVQWLQDSGIEGQIIELKTFDRDEDYIVSDRFTIAELGDEIVCNLKADYLKF